MAFYEFEKQVTSARDCACPEVLTRQYARKGEEERSSSCMHPRGSQCRSAAIATKMRSSCTRGRVGHMVRRWYLQAQRSSRHSGVFSRVLLVLGECCGRPPWPKYE